MNQTVEYIKELTAIASPTGFTREISDYLVKTLEDFGCQPVRTAKGGVNVTIKGQKDEQHRYVTAHVDTLGAIVRAVKPDGRLKLDRIGGFPWNMIEGENCTVHVASTGQKLSGTILIHQTSCHVYKDAGTAERTQDNMEVRLDAKVTNEKETRALGIEVGDFISFDPLLIWELWEMTSKQMSTQCPSVSRMLLDLITMTSVNIWLPWRKNKIFHLSWISIHFMVLTLQRLCLQGQRLNTPFSVLVSSLAILMSVLILTRWLQQSVWLMLI